ncbi:MAG: OmpA family protein [Nevskia sp.]|nr:OmpA family protein [Nevskia sp.]
MRTQPRFGLPFALLALLLAACAETPERAEQAAGAEDAIEAVDADTAELLPPAAPAVVPAAAVRSAMTSRRDALRRLLQSQIARSELTTPELRNDTLRTTWYSSALFENGTAELKPQALGGLSRVAKWLRADGASVLQVVGRQSGTDADDLSERRAAAVAAFLIAEGALAPRVRMQVVDLAQLRGSHPAGRGPDTDIALVVAPIVEGREAFAWIPPAVD